VALEAHQIIIEQKIKIIVIVSFFPISSTHPLSLS